LLVKFLATGQRGPERKDGRGEASQSGILNCLRLNARLEPLGPAENLLNTTQIYQFDAAISAGRVLLLATTEIGYIATSAVLTPETLVWSKTVQAVPSKELTSPAVLGADGAIHAAVIESAGSAHPRILAGQF
jgi:hypothetical protein